MKATKPILAALGLLTVVSFKESQPLKAIDVVGSYGVCAFAEGKTVLPELKLNADNTFHYTDNTNPEKPLDVRGSWKLSAATIVLREEAPAGTMRYHNKWNVEKNGYFINARKGMTFYHLCNRKACKN